MPNLANMISKAAKAEKLSYWDYVKKHQNKKRFGFRYERINTAALLEEEHRRKEEKRKLKYSESKGA